MTGETILQRIQNDMAAAMKARDADTLSTLRMLKATASTGSTNSSFRGRLSSRGWNFTEAIPPVLAALVKEFDSKW